MSCNLTKKNTEELDLCFPIRIIVENNVDIEGTFRECGIEFDDDNPYGNHISLRELDPEDKGSEIVIRKFNGHCLCNLDNDEKLKIYNLIDKLSAGNL